MTSEHTDLDEFHPWVVNWWLMYYMLVTRFRQGLWWRKEREN